jgi:hypothetical protein
MRHSRSLLALNAVLLTGFGVLGICATSCSSEKNTQFLSAKSAAVPFGAKSMGSEMIACPDKHRPLRVAFVIDNTKSNSETPGVVQTGNKLKGSDPIKKFSEDKYLLDDPDFKNLNTDGIYTHRQYAVYKSIRKLQRAGLEARAANPDFKGIDIGVTHFPEAPKFDPADPVKSSPNEEQMKNPVFHFGPETGLETKMTDVSKIQESPEFSQKVWDLLKFTHHPNGMTPYVTAFSAANTLLNEEKKADDSRQGIMILLTDGLPTDRAPSKIIEARKNLGTGNRVVLLQVYGFGEISDEKQNEGPKKTLAEMFKDGWKWGQEEHSSFETYWKALLAIPNSPEVRDDQLQVQTNKLNKGLDGLLKYLLKCNQN